MLAFSLATFVLAFTSAVSFCNSFLLHDFTNRYRVSTRRSESGVQVLRNDDDPQALKRMFSFVGKAEGLNKIVTESNEGRFRSFAISGRLKSVTSKPTHLSVLTFGLFPDPESCGMVILDINKSIVYKGESCGHMRAKRNLYAVETHFVFELTGGLYSGGVSTAIGQYSIEDDATKLVIAFDSVDLVLHRADGTKVSMTKNLSVPAVGSQKVLLQLLPLSVMEGNFGSVIFFVRY